jgi:hypothetical protein
VYTTQEGAVHRGPGLKLLLMYPHRAGAMCVGNRSRSVEAWYHHNTAAECGTVLQPGTCTAQERVLHRRYPNVVCHHAGTSAIIREGAEGWLTVSYATWPHVHNAPLSSLCLSSRAMLHLVPQHNCILIFQG